MPSSFSFLSSEYPELYVIADLSEKLIHVDPSSSLSKSRLFSEKLSILIWQFENMEEFHGTQIERINQLFYVNAIPDVVKDLLHRIRKSGNKASHDGLGSHSEALFILKKCFQLARWFYETYENTYIESTSYELPSEEVDDSVEKLETELAQLSGEIQNYKDKIAAFNANKDVVEERHVRAIKNANNIHKSEAETRELIDEQLREVGWECDTEVLNYKKNKTLPEKGKNIAIAEWPCQGKWADYALFVGTTLYGIVEAKKYATDISTDLRQSKVYSSLISEDANYKLLGDWNSYKVPFLFSANGRSYLEQLKTKSGIWFLDIRKARNHAEALRGWFSPEGLVTKYERDIDEANERLSDSDYEYLQNPKNLGLRDYQIDAIKAIEKKIITNAVEKRSLLVMATGTGKTRTVIGLAYRFIKSDRFKRILFLTDRRLLATQALGSFKDNKIEGINTFADVYQIEELKAITPEEDTRLHFATVQSLVRRLFYSENDPLPIDTYDCIIIDEAHRGYNLDKELDEEDLHFRDENDYISQYKRVIEYFNAYIIGLTATPALHTTEVFGEPVHSYSYREAVIDGYLVDHEPPYLLKTKLSEEGMLWEKGAQPKIYNSETNTIEELAVLEDELHIEIEQFNKVVITESFNREIIRQLVQEIDPEGEEKTMIFAARDSHADLIVKLLFEEFSIIGLDVPEDTIEKITGNVYNPEELTRRLKNEKFPSIVVTVDLLTTGIDVSTITNLVFLRRVRSRILFEQMLGRATRLCPDIDKQFFRIYDAVRVYEALQDYTQMKTVSNPSISFTKLVEELEHINTPERSKKQVDQIIAKLQRKKNRITDDHMDQFMYLAKGNSPEDFIDILKDIDGDSVQQVITEYASLWQFLDKKIYQPKVQLVSEHYDEYRPMERGYGKAEKPEDYIEGFKQFIAENRNTISALKVICTRPSELDRQSLKELKILLDQEGYNSLTLNTAWKNAKNQDIAADIISYIRTLALDTNLVSHEQRIRNAVTKVKELQQWNKIQQKWIDRFEAQLLKETVLTKDDLNQEPFMNDGGFKRLDKIFENKLEHILEVLNDNLYSA
ncbi:type I restriction-modification system endonuclease [Aquimarina sp. BL5]|uniref:type I restriction-modification system endonuclease n=1 Tax=Aquimarina sp. BL5 TaxID=1714860 RepID=UPI000E52E311|nr:type I restriction-modification system endonuclease [Aquimarina sp. BL5]AXT49486.1 type I restriction-modification system endonuclease [Aquimarina sp. BL5]RKN04382.1 type I restriction-modification system endonuclease [Aquimarina sp. BL5]